MPSAVENLLRNLRTERIRAKKAKLPAGRPKIPKRLETKYAIQLRNYQRAINREFLDTLEPIIASYRQDATTAEIETATIEAQKAVEAAILTGAVLNTIIKDQGNAVFAFNDAKYSPALYQLAGVNDVPQAVQNEMLTSWTTENIKLIKGINDEQIKKIETLLLRSQRGGATPQSLTQEIRKIMNTSVKRATLIARDQTLKLNGQIDRVKQTTAGITHFIWRTSRDERVRPEHRHREGVKYAWGELPEGEYPTQPVQCRCSAEPSFEEMLGPEFAAKEVKA
jgi:SPP1 gp7 family putative phage head morphogenesis protein